jgi:lysophospholipid acyltransferase (LPLAT)-like uncharacterized protein
LVGGPAPLAHRSRRRSTWLRRTAYAVAAPVLVGLFKLLWWTFRWRVVGDREALERAARREPLVLAFWHENLFVLARYLLDLDRAGARVTYLVSPSQDGELGVRMLGVVGGRAVRGSATRSGVRALRALYRAVARDGGSPVVAPDGPQGPRRHCKPGVVMLAKLSGAPIVPMACAARRSLRLPTWDRLLLPLPLTRVQVVVGTPYSVRPDMDPAELELERASLGERLLELGDRAELLIGGSPRPEQ